MVKYHKEGVQSVLQSYKDDPELAKIITQYLNFATKECIKLHCCLGNAIYAMCNDPRIGYAEGFLGTEISRYKLHAWNTWKDDFAFDLTSEALNGKTMPITATEWARGTEYSHVLRATNSGTQLAYKAHLHRINSPLEKQFSFFNNEEMETIHMRILFGGKCIVEEA